MIAVDTRERKWDHVREQFERLEIPYMMKKLDFGDYMVPGQPLSVDRKQNLEELAANLCTRDERRFWNEIRGAHKAGIKLIVLCEHSRNVKEPRDVLKWRSKYSRITGQMLFEAMFKASAAYGVQFRFCSKKQTGKRIVEILENG